MKNKEKYKKFKFDNGLKIILKPLPNTKKACIMININVGSINEDKKEYGISHFTEHLSFKSNKYRTAEQIAKDLEYAGTITNAFTSYDNTVYYGKCLKNKCQETIQILFEAITNTSYIRKEVELERQVVLTEVQNYIEFPDKHIFKLFLQDLYQNSDYGHAIEGTKETVSKISIKDLEDFKKKHYIANNMTICIVGNFEEKNIIDTIKNTFGKLKEIKLPKKKIILKNNEKKEKIHKRPNLNQSFFATGYIVPNAEKKESLYIELLSTLIGEGFSSRMFTRLREEKGIGYTVGAGYYNLGHTACFFMYVIGFDKKQELEVKKIVNNILEEIKTKKISKQEIEGIKNHYLSYYIDEMQKLEFHALELLNKERYNMYYDYTKKEISIRKITREDILATAKNTFSKKITFSLLK